MLICIRPEFSFISFLALAPLMDATSIAFGNALIRKYPEEPTLNWIFYQESLVRNILIGAMKPQFLFQK